MRKQEILKYILVFIIFLSIRLVYLGPDISNTDAYRWHHRSENFLAALKKGDFNSTYQHYQPGVTLMWINAFVKQLSFSIQYHILGDDTPLTLQDTNYFPFLHGVSKAVLVFILFLLLTLQMFLIAKIFDLHTSIIFGFLVSVEPYLIGIDRWFHLTSLESYLAFTAILLIIYWNKTEKLKYLVFSSLFLSLAVLTKLTALVSLPIMFFLIIKRSYKKMIHFTLTFIFFTFVFFPALISDTNNVLRKLYGALFSAAFEGTSGEIYTGILRWTFYDLNLLLKLSPFVLLMFLLAIIYYKKSLKTFESKILLFNLFIYYVFLTISEKKIDRYVISMFPYIILIATFYFTGLGKKLQIILFTFIGIHFFIVIYFFYPIFSSYNSLIFGGTKTALQLGIYNNSGEYFAPAARYLNNFGRDIKVFVPNGTPSFIYYFSGKLVYNMDQDPAYVVSSLNLKRIVPDNYGCNVLSNAFGTREKDIVFVYKCAMN